MTQNELDKLRALVAQWRENERELCRKADTSTASLAERLAYRADAFGKCADDLETLLAAPVVSIKEKQ